MTKSPAGSILLVAAIAAGVAGIIFIDPPCALAAEPGPAAAAPAAAPLDNQAAMEQVFDQFFKVGLDLEHPLQVRDLTIKRDTIEMTLKEGTVYLAQKVAGEVTGAYFTGTGLLRATLPNATDRKLMTAVYGKPVFEEAIGEAVLRFDDGTDGAILAAAEPGPKPSDDPTDIWEQRLKVEYNSIDLQLDFLEGRLNQSKTANFLAVDARQRDGKEWYSFVHNGRHRIENGLYHEKPMGAAGKRWYEVISMFHQASDYDAKGNYDLMPEFDNKDPFASRNVGMTLEIPNTKTVLIDARLTVEARKEGVRAARFELANNIDAANWYEKGRPVKVNLVADDAGNPLPYLHRWHQLLVVLPRPLAKGEKAVVHVKATEDTIIELAVSSYWIYTDSPWFPKIGGETGRYTFDWIVKVAKPMQAAGSGDLVREWQEANRNCNEWKSDVPVTLASFIFGDFKTTDGQYKREGGASGSVSLRLYTIQGATLRFTGKAENVLFNIEQGMKMYESIYGPFPYGQLDIAEMAHGLGFAQSPAGILLVGESLGTAGGGGLSDQVIFHELAHQWWGHQVGFVSEEDAWISESWAEYSAGLMTEAIDKKIFRRMIDEWRRYAIDADPYGTIATAYRSDSVQYPNARYNLLYKKGPYVVHMLRTWMGWEKFTKYVGTIQSKYKNTDISTDTLAREASATLGYDMFPFFDQWVRDRGIPKVHYSWTAKAEPDGKQLVTIKVRQGEADFKILMVPIYFSFGKGTPTVIVKPILKPNAEIQVKVPTVPKAVTMDDDATQLATFIPEAAQ
jgi:hypothetical protein